LLVFGPSNCGLACTVCGIDFWRVFGTQPVDLASSLFLIKKYRCKRLGTGLPDFDRGISVSWRSIKFLGPALAATSLSHVPVEDQRSKLALVSGGSSGTNAHRIQGSSGQGGCGLLKVTTRSVTWPHIRRLPAGICSLVQSSQPSNFLVRVPCS
jgi:hypothetical protein